MFTKEIYTERRKVLKSNVQDGVLLFLGNSEASCNYPSNQYLFRQDSSFLYFFGIDKPDFAATIDIESGEEIIYGNDVDLDDIIWMGPQPSVKDQAAEVGVYKTAPFAKLADYIADAQKRGRKIHFLPPYRNHNKMLLNAFLGLSFDKMKEAASEEFIHAIAEMRLIKQQCEIDEIDKACDLGYAMHYTAMKLMKLGMKEQELVGVMEGVAQSGGYMTSFPTILSQNGETLHNHSHHQILTEGRLCVIDAGVEIASHYCSDNTRTLPCSGKFTTQQAEIYKIVADANNRAREYSHPGIAYGEVHIEASRVILNGLKDLGLVKGDIEEALNAGAQGLFMPHGLGHNMGLDVHDMEDLGENNVGYNRQIQRSKRFNLSCLRMGRILEPGHVITDEPGIYFIPAFIDQWKSEGTCKDFINFDKLDAYRTFGGIRLEDDILVTEDGVRLLGHKRLPITVEDVEKEMSC